MSAPLDKLKKHATKLLVGGGLTAATFAGAHLNPNVNEPKKVSICNGNERWQVKAMLDEDAAQVRVNSTRKSTIRDLVATVDDKDTQKAQGWRVDNDNPRLPGEHSVVTITCRIYDALPQADGDIHLALQDVNDPNATMVAEIPNPNCENVKKSPFIGNFREVRAMWLERYQDKRVWNTGTFRIKGVVFFDKKNHGKGGNEKGVELHPVLSIKKI